MPMTLHTSHSGTVYPVYNGMGAGASLELSRVRAYYLTNAARYGYTRKEMQTVLSGHSIPLSDFQRRQMVRQKETGCCATFSTAQAAATLDPRTLRVGSVVPAMATRGEALKQVAALFPPDHSIGRVAASEFAPERVYLSGGSVVYPHGQGLKAGPYFYILIGAGVLALVALGVYARLRFYLAKQERSGTERRGPIHVAAPGGD